MIQTKWVLSCWMWLCTCCCGPAIAQTLDLTQLDDPPQTIELPILIPTTQETVVHVPDGGQIILGGGVYQPTIHVELVHVPVMENGSRVYRFSVDGKPWTISINEDDSIDVTMDKEFTIADIDELRKLHPDIAARFEEFPESSMRAEKIDWRLEITTSVSVMHEGQLQRLYPQMHEIFEQYVGPGERTDVAPTSGR